MNPNGIGSRGGPGTPTHFVRPQSASATRPAAGLTPGQISGFGTRLERLQTVVVPQRQEALQAARSEQTLARYALGDAHEAFRGTTVQTLEPLRQAAIDKLNGARNPAEELAARAELGAIETALRLANAGGRHEDVSAAVESVRRLLVGNVNGAQNPEQELSARAALHSLEAPIFEAQRGVDRATERLASATDRVNVASHQLVQAQNNANGLAAQLGRPVPYAANGFF